MRKYVTVSVYVQLCISICPSLMPVRSLMSLKENTCIAIILNSTHNWGPYIQYLGPRSWCTLTGQLDATPLTLPFFYATPLICNFGFSRVSRVNIKGKKCFMFYYFIARNLNYWSGSWCYEREGERDQCWAMQGPETVYCVSWSGYTGGNYPSCQDHPRG